MLFSLLSDELDISFDNAITSELAKLDYLFIKRDTSSLKNYQIQVNHQDLLSSIVENMLNILNGKHIEVIFNGVKGSFSYPNLITMITAENFEADMIQAQIIQFISTAQSNDEMESLCLSLLVLGTCYLEIYCQANYTGPELNDKSIISSEILHNTSIQLLECDGVYTYGSKFCQMPEMLFLARTILAVVADPSRGLYKHGILLSPDGNILANFTSKNSSLSIVNSSVQFLRTRYHRSLRALLIHLKLLNDQTHIILPTLWKECCDYIRLSSECYELNCKNETGFSLLYAQFLLECGLSYHFFEYGDKVIIYF